MFVSPFFFFILVSQFIIAASLKGHGLVVALLLIRGARVRVTNKSKLTPRGVAKGDAVEAFKIFEAKGTHGLLEKNKQISQKIVEEFKARIGIFFLLISFFLIIFFSSSS